MIILQILKIIGIVLACIVGLVLLIVLLVMLVPFTYHLKAKGGTIEAAEEQKAGFDLTAQAGVRWFLGLVSVSVDYAEKKLSYALKVAGIKIRKGSFGEKETEAVKEVLEEEKILEKDTDAASEPANVPEEQEEALKPEKEPESPEEKEPSEEPEPADDTKDESQSKLEQLKEKVRKVIDSIKEKYQKFLELKEKVEKVKYILGAPATKRALSCVKARIFDLLGHIRPRRLKGYARFGTGDPADTAQIYGAAAPILYLIDPHFSIVPEMEQKVVDMDFLIKGRFFVGYMVLLVLRILLNKDVRRVIKYVRRNF